MARESSSAERLPAQRANRASPAPRRCVAPATCRSGPGGVGSRRSVVLRPMVWAEAGATHDSGKCEAQNTLSAADPIPGKRAQAGWGWPLRCPWHRTEARATPKPKRAEEDALARSGPPFRAACLVCASLVG